MKHPDSATRELVLVGGGHTHVQVLRRLAMAPIDDLGVTVVLDVPVAVYSGMVPGFVAGQYDRRELEIDVVPLARRAGARVVLSAATAIDAAAKQIHLENRAPISYDVASLDVGSTVAGLETPGVRQFALPTRPVARLIEHIDRYLAHKINADTEEPPRIAVVGAGAGGVELAFAIRNRLANAGRGSLVSLVFATTRPLPSYRESVAAKIIKEAKRQQIALVPASRVVAVSATGLELESGERIAAEAVIWVAGAAPPAVIRDSDLPKDDLGFVRIDDSLRVIGHRDLFAAGDCASLAADPPVPKAGVYAVRQGPVLAENLTARLTGGRLRSYRPQRDFLTLLNLGDGRALGTKWGQSALGPYMMRLKDRIDREFMRRFQVLQEDGQLTDEFASAPAMTDDSEEMRCGGCAAKVGQSELARALARVGDLAGDVAASTNQQLTATKRAIQISGPLGRSLLGVRGGDDASAWQTPSGDVVVTSVDAFSAFTRDHWLVGRVAAVNAASDLHAKGVEPKVALAIVSLPEELEGQSAEEALFQILAGARATFDPLGVVLLGGHTTAGPDLRVGFQVEGTLDRTRSALPVEGLEPGHAVVLSAPLGTGVIFHADMKGRCRGPWLEAAIDSMVRGNRSAAALARQHNVSASTDVSGFGLAGHAAEMAYHSGVDIELHTGQIPALPGALELLELGERSTFHDRIARIRRGLRIDGGIERARLELIFDPQTAGGLLLGCAALGAEELVEALRADGRQAAIVGQAKRPDSASGNLHITT